MKSYIQGLITGAVFVFAFMVLTGANNKGEVGRYQLADVKFKTMHLIEKGHVDEEMTLMIDTMTGETQRVSSTVAGRKVIRTWNDFELDMVLPK